MTTPNQLRLTHQEFCQYSQTFRGNTARTISWLEQTIESYIYITEATKVEDLTKASVERWIMHGKLQRDWSAKTIKERLCALSLFCKWCTEQGLLEGNPVETIPRPKLPKRTPKHLTKQTALKLLDWVENYPYYYDIERPRAVAIISLFMYAGLRQEELRNLKNSEVDLVNRVIAIKEGKGKKDRLVPMSYRLYCVLNEYQQQKQRLGRCCPYFFTGIRKDEQMGPRAIRRLVVKIRDKSGIYFYPHMLRHTFATLMLEGGVDIYSLSKMMGHSNITTTTIYLSATVSHLQDQIKKHPLESFK